MGGAEGKEMVKECREEKEKKDAFTMIELTMFPSRTKEVKAGVFREITEELQKQLGIRPEDVFIVINDPPSENWGLAGKQRE